MSFFDQIGQKLGGRWGFHSNPNPNDGWAQQFADTTGQAGFFDRVKGLSSDPTFKSAIADVGGTPGEIADANAAQARKDQRQQLFAGVMQGISSALQSARAAPPPMQAPDVMGGWRPRELQMLRFGSTRPPPNFDPYWKGK